MAAVCKLTVVVGGCGIICDGGGCGICGICSGGGGGGGVSFGCEVFSISITVCCEKSARKGMGDASIWLTSS